MRVDLAAADQRFRRLGPWLKGLSAAARAIVFVGLLAVVGAGVYALAPFDAGIRSCDPAVLSWNDRSGYFDEVDGDAEPTDLGERIRQDALASARERSDGHPLTECGEGARSRLATAAAVVVVTAGLVTAGVYLFTD